jgi:hypothetical protein
MDALLDARGEVCSMLTEQTAPGTTGEKQDTASA